jgi:hypothetical protein
MPARNWTLSPDLRLGGAGLASASFGTGGTAAVILTTRRAEVITSGGSSWHGLPALPSGTATLAPGPGGQAEALAVHRAVLSVWGLSGRGTGWARTQVIAVPVQYGSSG